MQLIFLICTSIYGWGLAQYNTYIKQIINPIIYYIFKWLYVITDYIPRFLRIHDNNYIEKIITIPNEYIHQKTLLFDVCWVIWDNPYPFYYEELKCLMCRSYPLTYRIIINYQSNNTSKKIKINFSTNSYSNSDENIDTKIQCNCVEL